MEDIGTKCNVPGKWFDPAEIASERSSVASAIDNVPKRMK